MAWAAEKLLPVDQLRKFIPADSTSLRIFERRPRPMVSPAWMGTTVVLPSGCFRNTWLPFCL